MESKHSSPGSKRGRASDLPGVADLRQGGVLSRQLRGYQEWPSKIEMVALVAEALTTETHAIHITIASATVQFGFNVKLLTTLRAITVVGLVMMSRLKTVSFTGSSETLVLSVSSAAPKGSDQPPEPGAASVVRILPMRFTARQTAPLLKVLNSIQGAAAAIPEEQGARFYRSTEEADQPDEFGTSQEERDNRIESAFKELRAEGKRISGRALAARAHVHRTTSTRWLEAYRQEVARQQALR